MGRFKNMLLNMLMWLKKKLSHLYVLHIPVVFIRDILSGYQIYAELLHKLGGDGAILGTAWRGTGDYYICGRYLRAWLDENKINNYVFLVPRGAEERVTELFRVYSGHTFQLEDRFFRGLRSFRVFLGVKGCRFHYFHHQVVSTTNFKISITNGMLQGFKGINMVDFYLACGFKLPDGAVAEEPVFSTDIDKIQQLFQKLGLKPGRTVLLSPYSTGLRQYMLPMDVWKGIADTLKKSGYSVVTNCSREERPIPDTEGVMVPYKEIVPFLDMAGGFVGLRSGLCDIICSSKCKKTILYLYSSALWPSGRSVLYTGLRNMGLCPEVQELDLLEKGLLDKRKTGALIESISNNLF